MKKLLSIVLVIGFVAFVNQAQAQNKTNDNKEKPQKEQTVKKENPGNKNGHEKENNGKGNAYGKNKGDLKGKEFGQHRAADAHQKHNGNKPGENKNDKDKTKTKTEKDKPLSTKPKPVEQGKTTPGVKK
jgi:colicin import membrane protein